MNKQVKEDAKSLLPFCVGYVYEKYKINQK